jgi:hypothetical protein
MYRGKYSQSSDFPRETSFAAAFLHIQALCELSPPTPRGRDPTGAPPPTRSKTPPRQLRTHALASTWLHTLLRLLLSQAELPRPPPAPYRLDPQKCRHSPAVPRPGARPSKTHLYKTIDTPTHCTNNPYCGPDPPNPKRHYLPELHITRSTCWKARAPLIQI